MRDQDQEAQRGGSGSNVKRRSRRERYQEARGTRMTKVQGLISRGRINIRGIKIQGAISRDGSNISGTKIQGTISGRFQSKDG